MRNPPLGPSRLYSHLLARTGHVAPAMHRAAFAAARAANDEHLLKALVIRPDAPADLLEQYATLDNLTVRQAFLSRADGAGERLLPDREPERRAAVLVKLLSAMHPSAHAVHDALAALDAKPTVGLARALLHHAEWLTADQAATILRTLVSAKVAVDSNVHRTEKIARVAARAGRDVVTEVLATATAPELVTALVGFDVDDDVAEAALARMGRWLSAESSRYPRLITWAEEPLRVVNRTKMPSSAKRLTDAFVAAVTTQGVTAGAVVRARLGGRWQHVCVWDTTPADPPALPTAASSRPIADLTMADRVAIAAGPDVDALEEILEFELGRAADGAYNTVTYRALLLNPAFGLEGRRRVADLVQRAFAAQFVLEQIASLDIPSLPVVCGELTAVWVECFPGQVLRRQGWAPFGGPANAAEVVNGAARTAQLGRNEQERYETLVREAGTTGVPAEVIGDLLVADAMEILTRQPMPDTLAAHGWAAVLRRLGDEPGAWTLFDELVTGFPGTVNELIDTCVTATG